MEEKNVGTLFGLISRFPLLAKCISPAFPNSAIAEFETTDSPENTAFSAICLLTVHVNTPRSPNRFMSCLSGDLMVYPKIQSLILGL